MRRNGRGFCCVIGEDGGQVCGQAGEGCWLCNWRGERRGRAVGEQVGG